MTYEEWKIKSNAISNLVDIAEKKLNDITLKLCSEHSISLVSGGLVPEIIRNDKEYRNSMIEFRNTFNYYREFNKNSPKEFMKKRSLEYRSIKKWK